MLKSKSTARLHGQSSLGKTISLAGASVWTEPCDDQSIMDLAAMELCRYLTLLCGRLSERTNTIPTHGPVVLLVCDASNAKSWGVDVEDLGQEGYILKVLLRDGRPIVVVAANTYIALLYGVYALAELMGAGFWLGGDLFPDRDDPKSGCIPVDLHQIHKPIFAVRGQMLHDNFLVGITSWGLSDWRFHFEQMVKLRCNTLLLHWYDAEPATAAQYQGQFVAGAAAANSISKHWGATASLRTADFYFGSGDVFDAEIFGSPMAQSARDVHDEIQQTQDVIAQAFAWGRQLGIRIASGFEAPRGSPLDPQTRACFISRIERFISLYPDIRHFALWQHESGGSVGTAIPADGTDDAKLLSEQRRHFEYLGAPMRIWEAIRFCAFAQIAVETVKRVAPHIGIVLSGWGGDRWMQFADYCLGYDKLFPADVIFTCHENIDASVSTSVSSAWGKLPANRERWAMPWIENDLSDCWTRQPHVESLGKLAPDALQKGCQGLLTLHWRTRDIEEEAGFAARFAWDATLTPCDLYRLRARHAFGADHENDMSQKLQQLQRAGARWTGVPGSIECGNMVWTGWNPPIPLQLDVAALEHLARLARRASQSLSKVPGTIQRDADAGMFHHQISEKENGNAQFDATRPGVAEFTTVANEIEQLAQHGDIEQARKKLPLLEESIFQIRPGLIHFGIPVECHRPVDEFLIHCHHMTRHGDVEPKMLALRTMRGELEQLAKSYENSGRIRRIDSVDHLRFMMDFVLHFDAAAMLLAPGQAVETAIKEAQNAKEKADLHRASAVASQAFGTLVNAGMDRALAAMTRHLAVRGDWGALATVNVKPLPRYWQTIDMLESLMIAPPPRLSGRCELGNALLSWSKIFVSGITGYRVFRKIKHEQWEMIGADIHDPAITLFIDPHPPAGEVAYAVATLASDGTPGPMSHPIHLWIGKGQPPHVMACTPPAVLIAGQNLEVRVVVQCQSRPEQVQLHYQHSGDTQWQSQSMHQHFRSSFATSIPGEMIKPGLFHWYVQATDRDGQRGTWPRTAHDALPWTATVLVS